LSGRNISARICVCAVYAPNREAEIIEDLAQQPEDGYREALAGRMAEATRPICKAACPGLG
jgi:phytoene/squalene synthetase